MEVEKIRSVVWKIVIVALLYYATGELSFALFQQDKIVTLTVFIPEGIALAATLICGYTILPGIFIGQFILAQMTGLSPLSATGISLVNTLEAAMAYKLFGYFKLDVKLLRIRDLVGLFALIVFILQPFSAIMGNAILYFFQIRKESAFFQDIFFWWFGNILGQLLITPTILILYYNKQQTKYSEYILTVILFVMTNYMLQIEVGVENTSLLLIATLPLTIYLATVNLPYAMIGVLSLVASTLYFFHLGCGSFRAETESVYQLINMNYFILNHIFLVPFIGILFREKQAAIISLKTMAHYDLLTGLPNRYMLEEEIRRCNYLHKQFNYKGMICFIDIDDFKFVNDSYGHDIGDKLLKEVTYRIQHIIRSTDTLLRLGGDEFLLVLNNIDKEKTENLLGRIMHTVKQIDMIDNHKIEISLSIGVAHCPKDGANVREIVRAADNAMYQAKKSGKNSVVFTQNALLS